MFYLFATMKLCSCLYKCLPPSYYDGMWFLDLIAQDVNFLQANLRRNVDFLYFGVFNLFFVQLNI